MATVIRGKSDAYVKKIKDALNEYEEAHPGAQAELYRQNTASIRVRIIDKQFTKMSKAQRHEMVLTFLAERLNQDTLQELSVLLLLAPTETESSFMNFEFEHPVKSGF